MQTQSLSPIDALDRACENLTDIEQWALAAILATAISVQVEGEPPHYTLIDASEGSPFELSADLKQAVGLLDDFDHNALIRLHKLLTDGLYAANQHG